MSKKSLNTRTLTFYGWRWEESTTNTIGYAISPHNICYLYVLGMLIGKATDTQWGGVALQFMQVLLKESCILVRKIKNTFTRQRGVGRAITHYFILQGNQNFLCWWKDGRSHLEGTGLEVKLTNLLADLFEDGVIWWRWAMEWHKVERKTAQWKRTVNPATEKC